MNFHNKLDQKLEQFFSFNLQVGAFFLSVNLEQFWMEGKDENEWWKAKKEWTEKSRSSFGLVNSFHRLPWAQIKENIPFILTNSTQKSTFLCPMAFSTLKIIKKSGQHDQKTSRIIFHLTRICNTSKKVHLPFHSI